MEWISELGAVLVYKARRRARVRMVVVLGDVAL